MALIRCSHEIIRAVMKLAVDYGTKQNLQASEVGILSSGMNDVQVDALIAQAREMTAPLRRETEERWKRTGFDHATDPKGHS